MTLVHRIINLNDLESIVEGVYNCSGPTICEVVTDPDEKFRPKLQSKLLEDGTFKVPSLEDMYLSAERRDGGK